MYKGVISITEDIRSGPGSDICRIYFNKAAIKFVGFDDILFLELPGGLTIKRPTLESKITHSIKHNQFVYHSVNSEQLIGRYSISQEPGNDIFYLKKITT